MRRRLIWSLAAFLVVLALITYLKWRAAEKAQTTAAYARLDKTRIEAFWAAYSKASTLRTQGDYANAAAAYREALELGPAHEESLYYLGTCLYELGDYGEAQAVLEELVRKDPESGRGYAQLGRTLASLAPGGAANLEAARRAFERALRIYQEQTGPELELGILELNQGRWSRAGEHFRTAAAQGSPEAKVLSGYLLFLQNRPSEAEHLFQPVLKAYWADRKIASKGVLSEGDVLPAPDKPLSALQRAALRAALFSYWTALRNHVPSEKVAADLHLVSLPSIPAVPVRLQSEPLSGGDGEGLGAWADMDHHGQANLVVGGKRLTVYRNQAGKFVDVTKAAGLAGIRDVWQPYWVDFNRGGYPDLYLVRPGFRGTGQNLLYRNNGDGTFVDVTERRGLLGARSTMHACFADFTGSGKLDLLELGAAEADKASVRLFRNTGSRFIPVADSGLAGIATAVDCTVADYDRDGRPDVFVQYWRKGGVLYHNLGGGKFADVTSTAGIQTSCPESYSALFFDYDNDGRPDLLVTCHAPMEDVARSEMNPGSHGTLYAPRLFHNRGDGTFENITRATGLDHAYATMQVLAVDLDQDGWTDLLLVNGSPDAQYLAPTVILKNLAGVKFAESMPLPPGNFLGAAASSAGHKGSRYIYFASHPLLRSQSAGALFSVAASGPVLPKTSRVASGTGAR